jgi:hypothetical protein
MEMSKGTSSINRGFSSKPNEFDYLPVTNTSSLFKPGTFFLRLGTSPLKTLKVSVHWAQKPIVDQCGFHPNAIAINWG